MNEFKGTKGKWIYLKTETNPIDDQTIWSGVQTQNHAFDIIASNVIGKEELKANAVLISFAPDMLQVLKDTYMQIYSLSRVLPNDSDYKVGLKSRAEQIKNLIKSATEL